MHNQLPVAPHGLLPRSFPFAISVLWGCLLKHISVTFLTDTPCPPCNSLCLDNERMDWALGCPGTKSLLLYSCVYQAGEFGALIGRLLGDPQAL